MLPFSGSRSVSGVVTKVSTTVARHLRPRDRSRPGGGRIERRTCAWIRSSQPLIRPWADVRPVVLLSSELEPFGFLGAGERAVLTLAMAKPGAVAIIDELPGRRVAVGLGVKVTGALNVVLVAKQLGHVPAVRPILDRLQDLRFRVSSDLRDHILTLAGEG